MKHYKIYGMHFVSDFEFVQLKALSPEEEKEPVVFTILEGVVPQDYKWERNCYSHIGKEISFLANRTCFLLVKNGTGIVYEKKPGADTNNLNAYLLGWGIAMLCFQLGKAAIHCSCVADENGAILISGRSGGGKSTVTTTLLERGYSLVADDMVVVDKGENGAVYAFPAFPYQKLCRDVAVNGNCSLEEMLYIDEKKDKFLVPYKGHFETRPIPVRAMIILSWSEESEIKVEEITGADKLHACIDSLFLKVLFKDYLYCMENVTTCLQIAAGVPMYAVSRSKKHSTVKDLADNLEKML